jgi:cell division protein FtsZ
MLNAGAAVMGSAETRGENRARKAAEGALASPLLDNRDIMGAKKILLSIISGVEAELQMDELTEITEYIQDQAGEEAEMIFGHGVDTELGDRIRVTVIATGFAAESRLTTPAKKQAEQKKVHELERGQTWLFNPDNSVNEKRDLELRKRIEEDAQRAEDTNERELVFSGPYNKVESSFHENEEDDGEESLFSNDDFDPSTEKYSDQVIDEDGMMGVRSTKDRLQQQARERKEQLKQSRKQEMTKEEFSEKWSLPAYLRRGVKMQDVPHSSEPFISKFNLNDDNNILGNNKFLHDNVD